MTQALKKTQALNKPQSPQDTQTPNPQGPRLIIRPIVAEDEPRWRELWAAYLAFYAATVSPKIYTRTFARLCDPDDLAMQGRLAVVEDIPVGLVHFLRHDHCWRSDQVVYLQDLFTTRDMRGRGVARGLIDAVYDAADEQGCPTVYWMTQEFNFQARELYDKVGTLTPFIKYSRPE
ncbi:MAG: GNAT family N-acetyltransferase [Paracoccaceae bacterium]